MNVLYIGTRAPFGKMRGHKIGMRSYIRALRSLGHNVIVVAFSVPGDDPGENDLGVVTHYLRLPPKHRVAWNILTKNTTGELSINECLYASTEAEKIIDAVAKAFSIDFVVADMVRTAAYADRLGLPWFLDLDDLLSERYAMRATHSQTSENMLGYLDQAIPRALRPGARWMFRRMLSREARIMSEREVYWSRRALSANLHNDDEVAVFRQRSICRVFCLHNTTDIPEQPADAIAARPMSAVFLGGLTFQPNLETMREYEDAIIPEFIRRGVPIPSLTVIGNAPEKLRRQFRHPSIKFLGYVPDLQQTMCGFQVFFAPIVSGTGIKTKVLDAMASGVPVIAYPKALEALPRTGDMYCLRAETPNEFVHRFLLLRDNVDLAQSLAQTARRLVIEHYSADATKRILAAEIGRAKVEEISRARSDNALAA